MKLNFENIFEQQPITEYEKKMLFSYLKNDKSLLGAIYCKLIEYFCLEHVNAQEDESPPNIQNYKNKQYLLDNIIITFKIHESKLNFINMCKSVEYDLTPDRPVITTWNYYWSNFIDVTIYHAQSGIQLHQGIFHDPRLPGIKLRQNYFNNKHMQDVTEFDMFANMVLGRPQQNMIKVYAEYARFYNELIKTVDPKKFNVTKLSRTIEQKMLLQIHKKIYTYNQIKDLVLKRFND